METENRQATTDIPRHIYEYVILLREQGKTELEIGKALEERGYSDEAAMQIIAVSSLREAAAEQKLKDSKSGGCFAMVVGAVFVAVGLGITIYTDILPYGLIIFGVAAFIGGAASAVNNNRRIARHD